MADWDRTEFASKRLEAVLEGELYRGRRIIHRDSPIDGGVYLGKGEREAIVVDSGKDIQILELYEKIKKMARVDVPGFKGRILNAVYDTVIKSMVPNEPEIEGLLKMLNVGQDGKITLGSFLALKIGDCRHMALACGISLELFKKEGYIKGSASIDRNTVYHRGHVWCRYTNSSGKVFILDAAQKYIGKLNYARNWDYKRPTDN